MTDLGVALGAFHFIRTPWLLLVPVIVALWWIIRRRRDRRALPSEGIAPHLRAALTLGASDRGRLRPIDGVALALALAAAGAAGPTWSRMPDPFVARSAPLVVVLKVTPSMEETDVAPSRLERGKQKIRDLLELRAGARTALVAYAGSAHGVVPMTEDANVMTPYLEGLIPDVMPEEGARAAAALTLAAGFLAQEDAPGGVLFVADTLDPADVAALDAEGAPAVAVLSVLPENTRDRGFDRLSVPVVAVTPDAADVRELDRSLNAAYRQAMLENADQPWQDRGHWLAWPAALLTLLWFRRGWTMRWAALAALFLVPVPPAEAEVIDWFLTADQQGRIAFDRHEYERAAELFADPLWRGYALYREGQYSEAVQVLDRLETAEAAFIQGMAYIKSRAYRDGVRAFQAALDRDPQYPKAADNLAVAQEIVAYIEQSQEQSDTGQQDPPDAVALDNEEDRGTEIQTEVTQDDGEVPLATEQWMNTVDTRTGDFLRQRFAIEATQGPATAERQATE